MLVMEGPTMFGNYLIETAHTNYDSDVSDAEWVLIRPFMPRNKPNGSDMTTSMRDVVNAIFCSMPCGVKSGNVRDDPAIRQPASWTAKP